MSTGSIVERFGTDVTAMSRVREAAQSAPTTERPVGESTDARMWGEVANGTMFHAVGATRQALPPGFYRFRFVNPIGLCAVRVPNETDNIIELPDSESEVLLAEVSQFLGLRERFVERGLLYKRGIMLIGPPGSGKTATIQMLARMVAERMNSVTILCESPEECTLGLHMLRTIEAGRQVVVVLEDIDALVSRYGEDSLLGLLDGENQVENVVYIATTNYPERLDKRFVDRPSRFDTIRLIDMPTAQAREVYIRAREPALDDLEIKRFVKASEGYSIAHLRELLVLTRIFGKSLEEATDRLDKMRGTPPSSDRSFSGRAAGFGGR